MTASMGGRCGEPIRLQELLPSRPRHAHEKPRVTAAGWPHGSRLPIHSSLVARPVRPNARPLSSTPDARRSGRPTRESFACAPSRRSRPHTPMRPPASGRGRDSALRRIGRHAGWGGRVRNLEDEHLSRTDFAVSGPSPQAPETVPLPTAALASGHRADRKQASHVAQGISPHLGEPGRRLVTVDISTLGPGLPSVACWQR